MCWAVKISDVYQSEVRRSNELYHAVRNRDLYLVQLGAKMLCLVQ